MKRRFEVQVSAIITVEVDMDAESDAYPGETIMTAGDNPDRFRPGTTFHDVVGSAALTVGVHRRRVGGSDGWADYPEGTVTELGWPDWEVDGVWESTPGL